MKKLGDSVDWFFNKLLPKKFLVVVLGTIIVFRGVIVPDAFWYILMIYIGGNTVAKFANVFNKKG